MQWITLFAVLLTLLATLTSRRKTRVQLEDLKKEMRALADEVLALTALVGELTQSVNLEIQRVEEVIAKLKEGAIDPTELVPLIAELQTSVDNLKQTGTALNAAKASLDAEQPAPQAQATGA